MHTALLFQKVGLIVPDGDGNALHLKQRHIQVGLFPARSPHSVHMLGHTVDCAEEWIGVASYKVNASGVLEEKVMHFKSSGSAPSWKGNDSGGLSEGEGL